MTLPDAADTLATPGQLVDLTLPDRRPTFVIQPDTFVGAAGLSGGMLKRIVNHLVKLGDLNSLTYDQMGGALDLVSEVMLALLPGPSGRRFVERLNSDGEVDETTGEALVPPIDLLRQAIPALMYLLEAYGVRPTRPSSTSAGGSTNGNTQSEPASSVDGASSSESESTTLTQLATST